MWIVDEIGYTDKEGDGPFWLYSEIKTPSSYIFEIESLYFYGILKVLEKSVFHIKSKIENILKSIYCGKSIYSNGAEDLMKNLTLIFNTFDYLKNNTNDIIYGEISVLDLFNCGKIEINLFARFRHVLMEVSKILDNEDIRKLSIIMNKLHNIEKYYYYEKTKRKEYYLQPENFSEEVSMKEIKKFLGVKDNKISKSSPTQGNIIVFGDVGCGKNFVAKALKDSISVRNNISMDKIQVIEISNVCSGENIPYTIPKKEKGILYIYTAHALNIEDLKDKVAKNNKGYAFEDIKLFIDAKYNKETGHYYNIVEGIC